MNTITVNGTEYIRADSITTREPSDIKIVILQRGWVMVGRYTLDGDTVTLTNTKVIRRWGTTRGLGEIAADGPTSETVLDPAGRVQAHILTTVAVMDCDDVAWGDVL